MSYNIPYWGLFRHVVELALCPNMNSFAIREIDELESQKKWSEALSVAAKLFHEKPSKTIGIRYAFICWLILDEWGYFSDLYQEDNVDAQKGLNHVTEYLISTYERDPEVNFYLGYMMATTAWCFSKNTEELEARGKSMLKLSTELSPENDIYRLVALEAESESSNPLEYDLRKEVAPVILIQFQGQGGFGEYFRSVLRVQR